MAQDIVKTSQPKTVLTLSSMPRAAVYSTLTGALLVSLIFLHVVQSFLIALSLAGICAILARPLFAKLRHLVGGRDGIASGLTLLICIFAVIAPLMFIFYQAAAEAVEVFNDSDEFLEILSKDVHDLRDGTLQIPDWIPFEKDLELAGPQLYDKASDLLKSLATFFASSLSDLTNGTARFFLSLFAFLYAMFFFLPMQTSVFSQFLSYTALEPAFQDKLNRRIISVSRATIKGSLLIGVIQGALGGMGFWLAGFEGAIFWSVIMAILAAIPAVGATPVVLGGAIFLGIEGETTKAIILATWAILVVGSIDNVLRPRLVGKDADMSDLWIFASTLGGLSTFGPAGLVFGPVFAGIFITIWTEMAARTPEVIADNQAPAAPEDTGSSAKDPAQRGLRLTATKAEMEQELADLKRQLADRET